MFKEIPDYFPEKPWPCKCGCGFNNVSPVLVQKLNLARHNSQIPFIINSVCRCPKHNVNEGGKENSAHTMGLAADVQITDSRSRFKIIKAAIDVGFTRIGIAKSFIHMDIDPSKDPEVIWLYS